MSNRKEALKKGVVREMTAQDVERVDEILYAAWLDTYPNDELGISKDDLEAFLKPRIVDPNLSERQEKFESRRKEHTTRVVYESDGVVVGFCIASKYSDYNEIDSFYIDPEYQRQGVGTKLWNHVRDGFFDLKNDTVVRVATYNSGAIAAYESFGFERTDEIINDPRYEVKEGVIIPEVKMVLKANR